MNIDMRIAIEVGSVFKAANEGRDETIRAADNLKQLLSDVLDACIPQQLTEADNLDFNLHDDDPEGNCYYAYNCAVAEANGARKKLGL